MSERLFPALTRIDLCRRTRRPPRKFYFEDQDPFISPLFNPSLPDRTLTE